MSNNEMPVKNIEVFDGTCFQLWKFKMTHVLASCGLKKITVGTEKRPTEESKLEEWEMKDAKAMAITSSAVSKTQLKYLLKCKSSKEMWDKLSRIHEERSQVSKQSLHERFYSYKMNASESVNQYVAEIQNIASQLEDAGDKMSDGTVIAKILSGLPTKFSAFKSAWDSVEPERQTMEHLEERLAKEERKMSEENQMINAFATTNMDSKGKFQKKNHQNKREVKCYNCNGRGHIR